MNEQNLHPRLVPLPQRELKVSSGDPPKIVLTSWSSDTRIFKIYNFISTPWEPQGFPLFLRISFEFCAINKHFVYS
jgi:hypothetical protein